MASSMAPGGKSSVTSTRKASSLKLSGFSTQARPYRRCRAFKRCAASLTCLPTLLDKVVGTLGLNSSFGDSRWISRRYLPSASNSKSPLNKNCFVGPYARNLSRYAGCVVMNHDAISSPSSPECGSGFCSKRPLSCQKRPLSSTPSVISKSGGDRVVHPPAVRCASPCCRPERASPAARTSAPPACAPASRTRAPRPPDLLDLPWHRATSHARATAATRSIAPRRVAAS
mmetsp:Transcript_9916/g.29413  ORF Transcript_9916/g.29413 Transcript_9916/m.29413 type:complete len:229 (-) Transcript_9916:36-722(-)